MDTNVGNGYSSVGRRAHASGPGGSTGGISRVAAISLHTSPLAQPGTGDAGGMNVYVDQTSRRLAARGVKVEIFTRATSSDQPPVTEVVPGVLVRHIVAGPFEGLDKEELPGQLCSFAAGVMRAEARRDPGHYDLSLIHISEPTRRTPISYAVFCLKKKKTAT